MPRHATSLHADVDHTAPPTCPNTLQLQFGSQHARHALALALQTPFHTSAQGSRTRPVSSMSDDYWNLVLMSHLAVEDDGAGLQLTHEKAHAANEHYSEHCGAVVLGEGMRRLVPLAHGAAAAVEPDLIEAAKLGPQLSDLGGGRRGILGVCGCKNGKGIRCWR